VSVSLLQCSHKTDCYLDGWYVIMHSCCYGVIVVGLLDMAMLKQLWVH